MRKLASGLVWGEGIRTKDGVTWVSDTQGSRLWRGESGEWSAFDLDSPSNGLWLLPDGSLVGAMMMESRVARWNGQEFVTYADLADVAQGRLGDMVGDRHGNLYVDDLGLVDPDVAGPPRHGRLLWVGADGQTGVAAEGVDFPNGLALIDEGHTLVVAETFAQRLTAFDVDDDGRLGDRRLYADVAELVGENARPDGLWGDGDSVWVATLEGRRVVRLDDGKITAAVEVDGAPIACCTDASGSLYVTVADTRGRPVFEALADKDVSVEVWVAEAAELL